MKTSKPHAEIEMIASVIRVFTSHDEKYGDEYTWSAAVCYLNKDTMAKRQAREREK